MKNRVTKISKILLATFFICAISFSTNAQVMKKKKIKHGVTTNNSNSTNFKGCIQTLVKKSGEVFSVSPGILTVRATSHGVIVSIKKTGGRAETQVNIYVDGVLQQNRVIEFNNGDYTSPYKSELIRGVKGKMIKVEIVNQSVANTFRYTAKITGKTNSLMPNLKPVTGMLMGQGFKNIITKKPCEGKTKIIIRRTAGKARATIRIFERKSNGTYAKELKSVTFEKNKKIKVFTINSTKKLKIELKNISIGNTISYKINAIAIQ